ncbi:hypothetical protein VKT23_012938 [Stygiomarasmius scandens]|uniref:Fungal STAND N-terminal Goodbye domain-containing protein n=1 Tax=Marasmiellus scandens TaxID=2682957 RepID=A0ABR1J7F0_9AGAR
MASTLSLQDAQFLDIWNEAVKKYNHTLAGDKNAKMQEFRTKKDVLEYIEKPSTEFEKFKKKGQKIMKYLMPVIDIVGLLSNTVGEATALVFQPSKAIFTGIAMLVQEVKATSGMYDVVSDMLENLSDILARFKVHTQTSMGMELVEIYIRSMAQVLYIIGLITQVVKKGHLR